MDQLVDEGVLHHECRRMFRINKDAGKGQPLRLHAHQEQALRVARSGVNYVVTTGTGSGNSLTYFLPAVDHVLRNGPGRGIQAIVVYPMNALANSQLGELKKFLGQGYPDGRGPISFERYTGQESDEDKQRIMANPPDILLTNYVMLELILTRPDERRTLVQAAQGLQFLVLDELHTYRGRQGADVAMLVRRVRDALSAHHLQCVGTSATLAGPGTLQEQQAKVAEVASLLFGTEVRAENDLYEIERDTAACIMDTFPIVRRKDEATHGEYRTRRVNLEIYDAMAESMRTGRPYQTLLDAHARRRPPRRAPRRAPRRTPPRQLALPHPPATSNSAKINHVRLKQGFLLHG